MRSNPGREKQTNRGGCRNRPLRFLNVPMVDGNPFAILQQVLV